jgi:hypothetical protein
MHGGNGIPVDLPKSAPLHEADADGAEAGVDLTVMAVLGPLDKQPDILDCVFHINMFI